MAKPPILLLHGALGSADQLLPLANLLTSDFTVYNRSFSGHGGSAIPATGYRMDMLVADLESWMDDSFSEPVPAFGYSMGGYAATVLACRRPELFSRLITLGTKWDWTPESADREVSMLDTTVIAQKVPALADLIKARHAPQDWRLIVEATIGLIHALGRNPLLNQNHLAQLPVQVDVLWGSADRMVTREESEQTANRIPNGRFHILDGVKHPFEQLDPAVLMPFILE